jgi:hypothetical protein
VTGRRRLRRLVALAPAATIIRDTLIQMASCPYCLDGWVCEEHPNQPWPHSNLDKPDGQYAGPGMPCDCETGQTLVRRLEAKYRPIVRHDPRHLTEHHLWTLRKGERTAEARTRIVPIGDGRPELRIYCSRMSDPETLDLLWSQVLPGRASGGRSSRGKAAPVRNTRMDLDRDRLPHAQKCGKRCGTAGLVPQ